MRVAAAEGSALSPERVPPPGRLRTEPESGGRLESLRPCPPEATVQSLRPLAYQRAIADYLRAEEPGVWEWFSSNRFREKHAEQVRLDLLKATYRLEREGHGGALRRSPTRSAPPSVSGSP